MLHAVHISNRIGNVLQRKDVTAGAAVSHWMFHIPALCQTQEMPVKGELSKFPLSLSTQAVCVELLPSGERAPEQLRRVPRRQGHLGGAAQRRRPDAPGPDDGPGGRRPEPPQEQTVEAQPERVPAQASPRLTVRCVLYGTAANSCPGAAVSACCLSWTAGNPSLRDFSPVFQGRAGPVSKQACLSLPGN